MSDIHLDARSAFNNSDRARFRYPKGSHLYYGIMRNGYEDCLNEVVDPLKSEVAEKDKVIEGLRAPLVQFLEAAKQAKPFILMHGSLAQAEEVTHAMSLCEELLSSLAPTGTR